MIITSPMTLQFHPPNQRNQKKPPQAIRITLISPSPLLPMLMMLVMPMMLLPASILAPLTVPASAVLASTAVLALLCLVLLVLLELVLCKTAHDGSSYSA